MSDSAPHVTRLFGGPGSGKTTALLDRVEDLFENEDIDMGDILVVSYTRAAAAEVRERLAERMDIHPKSLQGNVCTMHAKAYDLLNLSRGDVVNESDKKEFCEEFGIEYEDEYQSAGRRTARSTALGNKIISTSQWLQRTDRQVVDWYDVPFQWDVEAVRLPPDIDPNALSGNKYTPTWSSDDDRLDVPEAIRAWRAYKGEHELVGFADMLERVAQRSLVPNVDHLVIDEFQDITTLQYKVFEEWRPHMKRILIAGDDDQVVYAWQGADPNLLLDADVNEDVILPNSYRLPSRILEVVNREIRHIDKRQEKDLNPRKDGGIVETRVNPSMLDVVRMVRGIANDDTEETVMVLFRARYQMFEFIDEFIPEGIPFSVMTDQRMWTDRFTGYVEAIEALDRGEGIPADTARQVADMLDDAAFGMKERSELFDAIDEEIEEHGEDVRIDPSFIREYAMFLPDPLSAAEMTRKITSFQRKSMQAYFANGQSESIDSHRIRVGTIHSAKGREADHVFVATDLTEKVVEQMSVITDPDVVPIDEEFTATTDPVPILTDNERRVFYVGMSRARERLVVLENLVGGAPTLPIDVLLCNEPTGRDAQDILTETSAIEAQ